MEHNIRKAKSGLPGSDTPWIALRGENRGPACETQSEELEHRASLYGAVCKQVLAVNEGGEGQPSNFVMSDVSVVHKKRQGVRSWLQQ